MDLRLVGERVRIGWQRSPECDAADRGPPLLSPAVGSCASREQYGSAKVACESTSRDLVGDRLLTVRPGLIGGPGDHTDRTGYWVARAARRPTAPMLVPDEPDLPTQVIDVRDLARWLVVAAQAGLTGPRNAVGPVIPFDTWVALSRRVGGHVGRVVRVAESRLSALGVQQWAGGRLSTCRRRADRWQLLLPRQLRLPPLRIRRVTRLGTL